MKTIKKQIQRDKERKSKCGETEKEKKNMEKKSFSQRDKYNIQSGNSKFRKYKTERI